MSNKPRHFFQFGPYRLDPDRRLLLCENRAVPVQPKAFDILLVLCENSGKVVPKEELLNKVWPDTFVEESNLAQNIFVLRKTLGDGVDEKRYIITVPGRGYRFAGRVSVIEEEEAVQGSKPGELPQDEGRLIVKGHTRSRIVVEEQEVPVKPLLTRGSRSRTLIAVASTIGVLIAAAAGYLYTHRPPKLTEKDTILLADFENQTGDSVFDGALRQGLSVELEQSPFLNLLSEQRIAQTLSLMTRPKDSRLSPEVAREVCQRSASAAVLNGTIAQIGARYLLTLKAINCATGDTLASAEATANDKDHVLDALSAIASDIRRKLGESLATVRKFDVTLNQATTPSLEALKASSLGEQKFLYQKDPASAVPYFQHALELDPNFAMAYVQLGVTYYSLSEPGRAKECFAKAFSLRDRTSERERLHIAATYYGYATGEIDKSIEAWQEALEIYKHTQSYNALTDLYSRLGQYEKSADAARMILAQNPDNSFGFANLALDDLALQNFTGFEQVVLQAQGRGVDSYLLHTYGYTLSFLHADSAGMDAEQRWFAARPTYENYGLALAANTEAYAGHVTKARELTRRAVDSAVRADNNEDAAMYRAHGALQEAAYGNSVEFRQSALDALKLAPGNPGVAVQTALAFAMAGDTARAVSLVQDLEKRFPLDTQLKLLGIPVIEAQLQLGRREPELALNTLAAGLNIEFANTAFSSINTSCLYPTYVRGQVYLAAGQGTAASSEFQKIIDRNGIVGNCWTGALAHLGLGRANALQSRTSHAADAGAARVRALAAYKDFLTLWKDADPNILVLEQAKAEYARLQ